MPVQPEKPPLSFLSEEAITTLAKKTLPRVLVLLAAFNGERWIIDQVRSVLEQNGVEVEIVVADDASTDSTWSVLREEFASHLRVTLLRRTVATGSAGANFRQLMSEARLDAVDFVALCDQDDIWHPDKLQAAIEELRRSGSDGYSCAVTACWPDGSIKHLAQASQPRAADFLFEGAGQGCTMVMSLHFFEKVRAFCRDHPQKCAELHYHDWLVYLLARAWQLRWVFDQRAWVEYRQHGGNEIGARGGLTSIRHRVALARSGWYRRQIDAASRIYAAAGGTDPSALGLVRHFTSVAETTMPTWRRASDLMRHGRRRRIDRWAVAAFAWLRWI